MFSFSHRQSANENAFKIIANAYQDKSFSYLSLVKVFLIYNKVMLMDKIYSIDRCI